MEYVGGASRPCASDACELRLSAGVCQHARAPAADCCFGACLGFLALYAGGEVWRRLPRVAEQAAPREDASAAADDGDDARQVVRQVVRQVPPATLVRYLFCMASALKHLHGMGVVHGDIKPQNMYITADGAACKLGACAGRAIGGR
eukprot:scaffold539_cov359-Prasinococcus_capsulatus_cf.AAC.29